MMPIDHPTSNSEGAVPEGPGQQPNHDAAGTVVIDLFPSDAVGAPIPGVPRGQTIYESHQAVFSDSDWAPFQSQRDWEVARWAKSCGATTTAVTKLLAIPGVRPVFVNKIHVTK
jgi:hypothetical protein